MSNGEPSKLAQYIRENPHATIEQIQNFADEHQLSVTFSGPYLGEPKDREEPSFSKFTYTTEDLKDMGAPWLQDENVINTEEESNGHSQN